MRNFGDFLMLLLLEISIYGTYAFASTYTALDPRRSLQRRSMSSSSQDNGLSHSNASLLAIITETSACDSLDEMERTLKALAQATSTKLVDLVSIRVDRPAITGDDAYNERHARVVELAQRLMDLAPIYGFRLVVSSDWVDAAAEAGVHGVHVKERHWPDMLPHIQQAFRAAHGDKSPKLLLGTSTHSMEGAVRAMKLHLPDYFFVGTCYETASHPEKVVLEGPQLPGQVRQKLLELVVTSDACPKVFAIGGVDEGNCAELTREYGADGVAVIRAVSDAADPAQAVIRLKENMAGTCSNKD